MLTYGNEIGLEKGDDNMLQIFEKRILRKIYGLINDNGMR
jgi:hypothetical protein